MSSYCWQWPSSIPPIVLDSVFVDRYIIWSVDDNVVVDGIIHPLYLEICDIRVIDVSNGAVLVIYFVSDGFAGSVRRRRSVVKDVMRTLALCGRLHRQRDAARIIDVLETAVVVLWNGE